MKIESDYPTMENTSEKTYEVVVKSGCPKCPLTGLMKMSEWGYLHAFIMLALEYEPHSMMTNELAKQMVDDVRLNGISIVHVGTKKECTTLINSCKQYGIVAEMNEV